MLTLTKSRIEQLLPNYKILLLLLLLLFLLLIIIIIIMIIIMWKHSTFFWTEAVKIVTRQWWRYAKIS